jgi:transcriptional regulator with XRE-family HTH domain
MTSGDIVRIARQRAGLTQQQLADRSGHPRETIARWETGTHEPSLSTLTDLVESSDLDLVIHLAKRDTSLDELVDDQLELSPSERLKQMLPAGESKDAKRALRWLSGARTSSIVIGGVAAVLQGAPQRPETSAVEFVASDPVAMAREMDASLTPIDTEDRWAESDVRAAWAVPRGGTLVLASKVPGTQDYRDLRRSAQTFELDKKTTGTVAHPRDLLRIADASSSDDDRARIPGLRALLERSRK